MLIFYFSFFVSWSQKPKKLLLTRGCHLDVWKMKKRPHFLSSQFCFGQVSGFQRARKVPFSGSCVKESSFYRSPEMIGELSELDEKG